jgi:hypothetical protein
VARRLNMISSNSIAVAVVVLLPVDLDAAAAALNRQLAPMLRFDATHLPHLTVVQQFVEAARVVEAGDIIGTTAEQFDPFRIEIRGAVSLPFEDTLVWYWQAELSTQLAAVHARVSAALAPLACDGNRDAFAADDAGPVRDSTVTYVREFAARGAGARFDPHVTLGFGGTLPPQEPFSFTADRLALCQLGDLNTCRRVLREASL